MDQKRPSNAADGHRFATTGHTGRPRCCGVHRAVRIGSAGRRDSLDRGADSHPQRGGGALGGGQHRPLERLGLGRRLPDAARLDPRRPGCRLLPLLPGTAVEGRLRPVLAWGGEPVVRRRGRRGRGPGHRELNPYRDPPDARRRRGGDLRHREMAAGSVPDHPRIRLRDLAAGQGTRSYRSRPSGRASRGLGDPGRPRGRVTDPAIRSRRAASRRPARLDHMGSQGGWSGRRSRCRFRAHRGSDRRGGGPGPGIVRDRTRP